MTREPVLLTVEAMAGSRTQEAAVSRSVPVCSRKPWTGGSEEDMVNKERAERRGEREIGPEDIWEASLCRDRRGLHWGWGLLFNQENGKQGGKETAKEFGDTHSRKARQAISEQSKLDLGEGSKSL